MNSKGSQRLLGNSGIDPRASVDNLASVQSPRRYFIHPLNSPFGHSLVETLTTRHGKGAAIFGTVDPLDDSQAPEEVCTLVTPANRKELIAFLTSCDVICFELLKTEVRLLEDIVSFFERNVFSGQKEFVLISHPLLWYQTAIHKSADLDSSDVFPANSGARNAKRDSALPGEPTWVTENDFFSRRTLPRFELARLTENRIHQLRLANPNIAPKIILPGILFGRGEDELDFLFQKLFETEPVFGVFESGQNWLPMVHVVSLAEKVVHLLALDHKEQQFFVFAGQERITQKSLLEAFVAQSQAGRLVDMVGIEQLAHEKYELMTLNLSLENSPVFQMKQNSVSSNSMTKMGTSKPRSVNSLSFADCFPQLMGEYLKFRDLPFTRLVVVAPDEIFEDQTFETRFKEKNGCQVVYLNQFIREILDESRTLAGQQEIIEQIEEAIQLERERLMAELADQLKKPKPKKGGPELAVDDPGFDIASILPKELLAKIFRGMLVESPLKYSNYLLRQVPRKPEVLSQLLKVLSPLELHHNLVFLSFEFASDYSAARISELESRVKAAPKNEAMKEELEKWRRLQDTYGPTCSRLEWQEAHVAHIAFTSPAIDWDQLLAELDTGATDIQTFVEAAPAPSETNTDTQPVQASAKDLSEADSVISETRREPMTQENVRNSRDLDPTKEEENLLSFKCLSIKQYLNDNVLPSLTEGIVEICRVKPEDPVAFLIQFLKDKQAAH